MGSDNNIKKENRSDFWLDIAPSGKPHPLVFTQFENIEHRNDLNHIKKQQKEIPVSYVIKTLIVKKKVDLYIRLFVGQQLWVHDL